MVASLVGSEILKIAGEIGAMVAQGKKIANFTVGDFDPKYFPIPELLKSEIHAAIDAGLTNYPPSSGMPKLREAVAAFYQREFGFPVKSGEILIAGGARPLIYSTFLALLNPGDKVVYPVPSWNNNHYTHLARAEGVILETKPENNFLPTLADLAPHLKTARLICLNSPLNPSGTVFSESALREICIAILKENGRRKQAGESELYLMYDHIYWMIRHGGQRHMNPIALLPEMREYTVFIDGVSKYFCGTGLRVGWAMMPEKILLPFSNLLGHVGAWAPKPEQEATARYLTNTGAVKDFMGTLHRELEGRLRPLYEGLLDMKKRGLPVDVIEPQGGIYLSLRILPRGQLQTNEKIRRSLLEQGSIAVVPFQAFGYPKDDGWFRMSVGAVSVADIHFALEKLEAYFTS